MLIPSSNINTTPELRIFISTGFLRFFRRFPQINVGGDSTHLSSFGKCTREPRLRSPAKGHVATDPFIHISYMFITCSVYCLNLFNTVTIFDHIFLDLTLLFGSKMKKNVYYFQLLDTTYHYIKLDHCQQLNL